MRRAARAQPGRSSPARPAARAQPRPPPAPMLATPVAGPFSREGWLFELKYDGVRALASIASDEMRIVGRSGPDETGRYPELRPRGRFVRAPDAAPDGELVDADARGASSSDGP